MFVATNVCRDKNMFVAIKVLSRQKTFVATKMILVAAPVNDREEQYLRLRCQHQAEPEATASATENGQLTHC